MMSTKKPTRWAAALAALGLAAMLSSCGSLSGSSSDASGGPCVGVEAGSVDSTALEGVTVKVGSKDLDEQLILAQLTIKMLCAAGADVVDTTTNGSIRSRKKLQDGVVDVLWEYTGTGWIAYLGHDDPILDEKELYRAVRKEDLAENKLLWGPMAPFNDTYAFSVTDEFARKTGVSTSSDMAKYINADPGSTVCVESEYAARPDGYPGYKKLYEFGGEKLKSLDTGAVYALTDKGACDFGEVFATDGRLAALGLTVLDDDKKYHPPYNGVVVTRADFDKAHPEMLEVLKPLADSLTTDKMTTLNKLKSSDGEKLDKIATDYLTKEGFLK